MNTIWRDSLRPVPFVEFGTGRRLSLPSSIVPLQAMEFALEGPVVSPVNQTMTYRVMADIFPLCGIAFLLAQLGIPKIPLPQGQGGKPAGHSIFPESHPTAQRRRRPRSRCAKEMHVIGHHHIASHPPAVRLLPALHKGGMHLCRGQHLLASLRAARDKNHD